MLIEILFQELKKNALSKKKLFYNNIIIIELILNIKIFLIYILKIRYLDCNIDKNSDKEKASRTKLILPYNDTIN